MTAADRSGMTEAQIEAIDRMYSAAKVVRDHAEADLRLADDLFRVASALHDVAHAPTLRGVS